MERQIIDVIKERVAATPSSQVLDFKVVPDSPELRSFLEAVVVKTHLETEIDIPVRSMVSLRRNGLCQPGDTWRSILMDRITGDGWRPEVIDYFEQPIRDRLFPADKSRCPLDLDMTGGIGTCANGNHRIVGAICWLAATRGDDAVMQSVRTTVRDIDRTLIGRLVEFHRTGARIGWQNQVGLTVPDGIRVSDVDGTERLIICGKGRPIREIAYRKKWLSRKKTTDEMAGEYQMASAYHPIPDTLFDVWGRAD